MLRMVRIFKCDACKYSEEFDFPTGETVPPEFLAEASKLPPGWRELRVSGNEQGCNEHLCAKCWYNLTGMATSVPAETPPAPPKKLAAVPKAHLCDTCWNSCKCEDRIVLECHTYKETTR